MEQQLPGPPAPNKKDEAYASIVVSMVLLVLFVLGAALLSVASGQRVMSLQQVEQFQTYYIADAGIEHVLARACSSRDWLDGLNAGKDINLPAETFAGGVINITVKKSLDASGVVTLHIESLGKLRSLKRTLVVDAVIDGKSVDILYWQEKYHPFPKDI